VRVVRDTNVVMSGLCFGGVTSRILEAWNRGGFDWVVSIAVLTEYRRVGLELGARYPARRAVVEAFLAAVESRATTVAAAPLRDPVTADPDDDMLFALALAARARTIVSGDHHVRAHDGWRRIAVHTPRSFVDTFGPHVGIYHRHVPAGVQAVAESRSTCRAGTPQTSWC
jgi:putative PIN family toxin of toxin-antitoxin system